MAELKQRDDLLALGASLGDAEGDGGEAVRKIESESYATWFRSTSPWSSQCRPT